jgi:plastocyanin
MTNVPFCRCAPQRTMRAMFRRATLAALAVLLIAATNVSAAGVTVNIAARKFNPKAVTINVCDTVAWHNKTAKKRTVVSNVQFLPPNVVVAAGATSSPIAFTQAGTFTYHDKAKASRKGTVAVRPTVTPENGTTSTAFDVTVACATTPSQFTHDIQVRVNDGPWQVRGGTSGQVFHFAAGSAGVWDIQTRMHYLLSGAKSDWSPMVTVAVN